MSTRMLIDARHAEETRVTVVRGSRVEEFDYESASRRQLKGNIYLARVTRVEPSLQAAFVEYGGNRHGFLAFSEIHPDYYQIPVEDREALIEAEAEALTESIDAGDDDAAADAADADTDDADASADDDAEGDTVADAPVESASEDDDAAEDADADVEDAETEGDQDVAAAAATRRRALRAIKRRYNIQEVIKKRQVLLVQVVKEERGNKGAALTTYLSLAGRYCVLMPNSTNTGGISRKISSATDRRKLKTIISSLEVPSDMGLIVRTAGMNRTKTEIKRDYEYLTRLWGDIRELTLQSIAPCRVYEEADLIRRTIRDLYSRDMDEILVEGEQGYRAAKDFMKLLVPSHAKKVKHYKDKIPLFHRYQVEGQLESMFQPVVNLRSGGYLVINPTEALISVDVNSGRSTREHNIEGTALKTNLEAAEEVARQLKLRDMAGLVVIDFIDMEDRSNIRSVERRMKDMLKTDRARVQLGRISSFGLMEMSRQRLRPNLIEASMAPCEHCHGTGLVRSVDSAALLALRQLEEEGIRARSQSVRVAAHADVATFLLNVKRPQLMELEEKYGMTIEIVGRLDLGQSEFEISRIPVGADPDAAPEVVTMAQPAAAPEPAPQQPSRPAKADTDDDDRNPRKRRRRRRRKGRGDGDETESTAASDEDSQNEQSAKGDEDDENRPKRRRGRRGGRRRRQEQNPAEASEAQGDDAPADGAEAGDAPVDTSDDTAADGEDKPRRRRRRAKPAGDDDAPKADAENSADASADSKPKTPRTRRKKADADTDNAEKAEANAAKADADASAETAAPKPRRRTRKTAANATDEKPAADSEPKSEPAPAPSKAASSSSAPSESAPKEAASPAPAPAPAPVEAEDSDRPKRKGWWQRTFG